MMHFKRKLKDEKGSATLEFLGILPLAIFILCVILQIIVAFYSVIVTQSAANEYADVYAVTESEYKAEQAANNIISSSENYLHASFSQARTGKDFSVAAHASVSLIFLPEKVFGHLVPAIPYSTTAHGRVIK